MHTHIHKHTRACLDTHTYTQALTYTHTHEHIHTHTHTHTHTHSHTHTHTNTHIHTHEHAHIHRPSGRHFFSQQGGSAPVPPSFLHILYRGMGCAFEVSFCSRAHMHAKTHTNTCVHPDKNTNIHVQTHAKNMQTHASIHSIPIACTHTHTITLTLLRSHTRARTHTHTHTTPGTTCARTGHAPSAKDTWRRTSLTYSLTQSLRKSACPPSPPPASSSAAQP